MGMILSYFWDHPDDTVVNPVTRLTELEKSLVQKTWGILRKDHVAAGGAIMMALLTKHPTYQKDFKVLAHLTLEELPKNKRMQVHSANVAAAISTAVDALDNLELLAAFLINLGEKHKSRGQTPEQFINLKSVVLDVLREVLGKEFTPKAEVAWVKTMDALVSTIIEVLNS